MQTAPERTLVATEIRARLHGYCRGVDRMDIRLTLEAFHPEARLQYAGLFDGTPQEFVDWLWPFHHSLVGHVHQLTNISITFDPGRSVAGSEAYVQATLRRATANGAEDVIGKGRYLDRWSQDGDSWKIFHRQFVMDLRTVVPVRDDGAVAPRRDDTRLRPSRDATDPSYDVLHPGGAPDETARFPQM